MKLTQEDVWPRSWAPAVGSTLRNRRPPQGALVAIRREPCRVLAVVDIDPHAWSEQARRRWATCGALNPATWPDRPFRVELAPVDGRRRFTLIVEPDMWPNWAQMPEHYAVCSQCGELAPCIAHTAFAQALTEMARVEREEALLPGCCPACQEPVTTRQRSITFPGLYLLLPTGPSDPTFHLRGRCWPHAASYEELWVTADPTRPRSLLTMRCSGTVVVHHDGSRECRGATNGECPSLHADHRSTRACYVLPDGCPRGRPVEGLPGTHLARPARTS